MLKIKQFHNISTKDSLALHLFHRNVVQSDYFIISGFSITINDPTHVDIGLGKAYILQNLCYIENISVDTIDVTTILSQPELGLIDGHHGLVISLSLETKTVNYSLVLETSPNVWDNLPSPHYVVLGVLEVVSGSISTIHDEYGPWKRVLFPSGAGGAISGLIIKDEGSVINNNATILNFIGTDVYSETDFSDITQVNIYIPPPSYVSHFNTTDGTTNALVNPVTTYNRFVANPTTEGDPYKIGDWTPGSQHPCIQSGTLTYSPNEPFSCKNDSTTFEVNVFDANGTNLLASCSTTIDSTKTVTENHITINISNFSTDQNKYKCMLTVTIDLQSILPHGGRFSINIVHYDSDEGTFIFNQNDIFYDTNENLSVINGPINLSTTSTENIIQISGVYYYTLGTQFNFDFQDIDFLNDRSYPLYQIDVDPTQLGISSFSLRGSDLTGWNYQWDDVDDSYNNNHEIDIHNYCYIGDALYRVRTEDWVAGSWVDSNSIPVAINTYDENSTRIYEDFVNETQRLDSSYNSWDSTQSLLTYDGGTGLQVRCSRLIYPTENFQGINPNPTAQPNYSSATGDRIYIRRMWHNNVSHSNGIFRLFDYNITENDLTNHDIEIWISLNGTDWFICNDDYAGGELSNGSGCRVNRDQYNLSDNNQIAFTFGSNKYTDYSTGGGWGMYVKIVFKDNPVGKSRYLGGITEITWL